jgi:DNA polymerase-1
MKTKEIRYHPFELINQWSVVSCHGASLTINPPFFTFSGDVVALDVEDDEQGGFVGLGIAAGTFCYYWSDFELAKTLQLPKFIAHNGMSDIRKLQKWGFKIDESWLIHDTQLIGHIEDSSLRTYGLKDMVKREFGVEYPSYESICGKKTSKGHKTLKDFPVEAVAHYNACDTYWTFMLWMKQRHVELKYFKEIEQPVAAVFSAMQEKGIRIDLPYLTQLEKDLSSKRAVIEKEIKNELGDINLNSPKQLLEALHAKEIYPELKGKASTDKRALERLKTDDRVSLLLKYSELETLLSSFVKPYLERASENNAGLLTVHPSYLQTGTRTGRPSCSNPNLLQIPRKTDNGKLVRRMFIPRDGCTFGELDYGQIEPRLLAHLSQDQAMLGMFNEGVDFHTFTATRLNISRDAAKVLNLSVGYRATFKSVSQQLKCSDEEAQKQINDWWRMFPQLKAWQDKLIYDSKRLGYFTTLMGRRIKVDNLNEYNLWRREHAQRQLINNIAQASAAEVMKMAMIRAHKDGINILVQVYDSLLIEEKEEEILEKVGWTKAVMEQTTKLSVPLTVDTGIGNNWEACK